jgi:hypothetical protein
MSEPSLGAGIASETCRPRDSIAGLYNVPTSAFQSHVLFKAVIVFPFE